MPSSFRVHHKQKNTADGVAVEFHESDLGYPLDAAVGNFQITCKALGGGTWGVDGLFKDAVWRELQATGVLVEASVFHVVEKFAVLGVRVKFAAVAPGTTTVVTVSAQGREHRFSTGV